MMYTDISDKLMRSQSFDAERSGFACNAWQVLDMENEISEQKRYNAQKDNVIFQTAEEIKKQNIILAEQNISLKEQNKLLNDLYEKEKEGSEESRKRAHGDKIRGWVSMIVGAVIGVVGILVGALI